MQAHYDEGQRQLAVTLDQLAIAQRKLQSLTGEMEELRGNYDSVSANKRCRYIFFQSKYFHFVLKMGLYLFLGIT